MTEIDNISTTDRFFAVLDVLLATNKTKLQTFCRELNVDKRNFVKQRDDHTRQMLKTSWLSFIVVNYNVNANWLLTGRGEMFNE